LQYLELALTGLACHGSPLTGDVVVADIIWT
jgi:hypothetical protein